MSDAMDLERDLEYTVDHYEAEIERYEAELAAVRAEVLFQAQEVDRLREDNSDLRGAIRRDGVELARLRALLHMREGDWEQNKRDADELARLREEIEQWRKEAQYKEDERVRLREALEQVMTVGDRAAVVIACNALKETT